MSYTAQRDFTDSLGKTHQKGEPVEGLAQSEIQKLVADGSIKESAK
jgi:hypothetical protein